jgi:hypothetical protein
MGRGLKHPSELKPTGNILCTMQNTLKKRFFMQLFFSAQRGRQYRSLVDPETIAF